MSTTLVVTNDFPPRIGGIESFVADACALLGAQVVVYTATAPGSDRFDAQLPYPVLRDPGPLLPTPRTIRRASALLRAYGADRVLFGAAAPLALMTRALRRAGAVRVVALTHGHEVWWAALPGARRLLYRIGNDVDHLTAVSAFTSDRMTPALSPIARERQRRLAPPVDTDLFRPEPLNRPAGRRRCIAVGRLVRQKGVDTLLRAWRLVLRRHPRNEQQPELVVVGDGPQRAKLQRLGAELGLAGSVIWTGALPRPAVAAQLQAADVFALPVRTRLRGLNPEGLGLAALEAAACGLPVLVGDSGGAPETVRPGETGYVVDPADSAALADRLAMLLTNPALARRMGAAGRSYVTGSFGVTAARATLLQILGLAGQPDRTDSGGYAVTADHEARGHAG